MTAPPLEAAEREGSPPALSVVIPTYNRRESLMVTLDALARQTYPAAAVEVLVVSDGSTDGTDDALDARAAGGADPYRLRPIRQQNGGPSRARNRGVAEAGGRLLVFLDDDVEPDPGLLAAHVAHHDAGAPLAVIGPMLPAPDRKWKEPVWVAWEHAMLIKQYDAWESGLWDEVGPHNFYSGNASLAREHVLAVHGFDETYRRQEDVELAERLANERGMTFAFDARAFVLHRPVRKFSSWLDIPRSYGRLDVLRAAREPENAGAWKAVRNKAFVDRNAATRAVIGLMLRGALPGGADAFRAAAMSAARTLYRAHRTAPAFALVSVVYNLTYVEGALAAVDGARSAILALLLRGDHAPAEAAVREGQRRDAAYGSAAAAQRDP